jgi:hypothetical protein
MWNGGIVLGVIFRAGFVSGVLMIINQRRQVESRSVTSHTAAVLFLYFCHRFWMACAD